MRHEMEHVEMEQQDRQTFRLSRPWSYWAVFGSIAILFAAKAVMAGIIIHICHASCGPELYTAIEPRVYRNLWGTVAASILVALVMLYHFVMGALDVRNTILTLDSDELAIRDRWGRHHSLALKTIEELRVRPRRCHFPPEIVISSRNNRKHVIEGIRSQDTFVMDIVRAAGLSTQRENARETVYSKS